MFHVTYSINRPSVIHKDKDIVCSVFIVKPSNHHNPFLSVGIRVKSCCNFYLHCLKNICIVFYKVMTYPLYVSNCSELVLHICINENSTDLTIDKYMHSRSFYDYSIWICHAISIGISIIKIRRSNNHRIFMMGINIDDVQQSFCMCTQPMRNGITVWRPLLLAGCIHRMIPACLSIESHPRFLPSSGREWDSLRVNSRNAVCLYQHICTYIHTYIHIYIHSKEYKLHIEYTLISPLFILNCEFYAVTCYHAASKNIDLLSIYNYLLTNLSNCRPNKTIFILQMTFCANIFDTRTFWFQCHWCS